MYEKIDSCPSCKNTQFKNHLIGKDHSVSGDSFAIVACAKCQLLFTNPRPSQESIGEYYKSEDYISHTNKGNNLINRVYKFVRNLSLKKKYRLIQSYLQPTQVLDFGCGTGHFIKFLSNKGIEVDGVEPDPGAAEIASKQLGKTVHGSLEEVEGKYDVITAWHVLEHVHDLRGTIKMLKKKLKKEGYLFIAVPNIQSFDSQHYGEFWAGLDVPRHLYHFSRESFLNLAKKTKLNLVDVHPMIFDSYYVSMLSEKYKHGKIDYLKAYQIGKKSNQMAKTTGEYSSLIYVLQK